MRTCREITHLLCKILMPNELEVFLQLYGNSTYETRVVCRVDFECRYIILFM
jgi:hypothetical protein